MSSPGNPDIIAKICKGRLAVLLGDGKADLVAATVETITVLLGDGQGSFTAAPGSPFPAGKGTWRLVVADLNGDGKPDIAATSLESDQVTILLAK